MGSGGLARKSASQFLGGRVWKERGGGLVDWRAGRNEVVQEKGWGERMLKM